MTNPSVSSFLNNSGDWLVSSEMGKLIESMDWSLTPLGPLATWPQSLRTTVNICLDSRLPIALWLGAERTMLYNDAYRPLLGQSKHPQFLGGSGQACWAEIWDIVGPLMDQVIETGKSIWYENFLLEMFRFDYLEETYFTFSFSPIRDEQGRPWGVFNACFESTLPVINERRLKTLREMAVGLQTVDEVARQCMEIIGHNRRDIPFALVYLLDEAGTHLRLAGQAGLAAGTLASPLLVDMAEMETTGWPLARVMAQGTPDLVDDIDTRFEGLPTEPWGESPHRAMMLPIIRSGRAEPIGVLVLGISPRRAFDDDYRGFFELVVGHLNTAIANARAYEEERQHAKAMAALDQAKTTFFSNVSHEFRTPLTLMLGPLQELIYSPHVVALPEGERQQLDLAYRNALRLLKLVNSLLDFSRIESDRMRAHYAPTDLATFTAELASMFTSAIENADIRYIVDCPPLPEPVYVDTDLWEKIVLNLISNAFKFTFQGSITVRLRWEDSHAELSVTDTGIGVPQEHLPRLFERFHRVENARSRSQEGTGIGLALVQELVKLHGGTISVTSTLGVGTTFTVTVPGGTVHLRPEQIGARPSLATTAIKAQTFVEEAQAWLPGTTAPSSVMTESGHRPRILWADDNADMRAYVRELLVPYWDVESVADGQQALESALRDPPDLVLSDIMMPNLDGFGLLQALRANPRTNCTPVILLSARAGEEARVEGLQAGADDYLVKPFGARELLARISTHLGIVRLRKEAIELAQHDVLTGLPNRKLSYEFAERLLDSARRGQTRVAVMFIDMDYFKPINDTYGHEVGDAVLKEVAKRLITCVRGEDTAGRLGGDEFLVVLSHIHDVSDVAHAAQHLVNCLCEPYRVGNLELHSSPSIGISLFPDDGDDLETLLQHADIAMYHAKKGGRNNFQLYTPALNESAALVLRIESRLQSAIERDELRLHYQPIIDIATQAVIGAEALMRWPATGVAPNDFIPVAETCGMIGPIGAWELNEACRQARQWQDHGLPAMMLSVNISPLQFRQLTLRENIETALRAHNIAPGNLQLELSETMLLKNPDESIAILRGIKALGVKIALDDFGKGDSNLGLLGQRLIDTLKVDQEFVRKLATDEAGADVTEDIIDISKTLGLHIVAKGIESAEMHVMLLDSDCLQMQGYHLSPPLSGQEFEDWYRLRLAA